MPRHRPPSLTEHCCGLDRHPPEKHPLPDCP